MKKFKKHKVINIITLFLFLSISYFLIKPALQERIERRHINLERRQALTLEGMHKKHNEYQSQENKKVDDFLGPEQANLCLKNKDGKKLEKNCTDPIVISVLCDISQLSLCQLAAQSVRSSPSMFLLYPYMVTEDVLNLRADYTLVISNSPADRVHDLVLLEGHFSLEEGSISIPTEVARIRTHGSLLNTTMGFAFRGNMNRMKYYLEKMILQKETVHTTVE